MNSRVGDTRRARDVGRGNVFHRALARELVIDERWGVVDDDDAPDSTHAHKKASDLTDIIPRVVKRFPSDRIGAYHERDVVGFKPPVHPLLLGHKDQRQMFLWCTEVQNLENREKAHKHRDITERVKLSG